MTYLPQNNYGSVSLARMRAAALAERLGPDADAAQAAQGRYLALSRKAVPQRGSTSPAAVAWAREAARRGGPSDGVAGYLNRRYRRYRRHLRQAPIVAKLVA